jgi:hypothetical protein
VPLAPDAFPSSGDHDGLDPDRDRRPRGRSTKEDEMYHPLILRDLAAMRMADDIRQAERDRRVREAASARSTRAIDAVPFRERVARLFDAAGHLPGRGLPAGA